MRIWLICFVALMFSGCNDLSERQKEQPRVEQPSSAPSQPAVSTQEKRFVLPAESSPFPASSVALDTTTGQLCKTYAWEDNAHLPKGLSMCSELGASSQASLTGASKSYRGSTYSFNGAKWVKGNKALMYNAQTQGMDPLSDDQYDPLKLFSKEEKAKRTLTEEQIRKVAGQFSVSYQEAWEDAKQQGYQVPSIPKP